MTEKPTYLLDTSAALVSLGESTPAHCRHFAAAVADGELHTSVYVRKEFIQRWILGYVRMAFAVYQSSNVSDALFDLSQDFSIRDVKVQSHAIALLLKEKGAIENSRTAAIELGRLAFGELKKFDRRLRSRIPNLSGCRIGEQRLTLDFNRFFQDLRAFVESVEPVEGCDVNEFLGFTTNGHACRLLEAQDVQQKTKAGKQLAKLRDQGKWITCKECATIGDAIIALEQPATHCLVHIDNDFKILCTALGRRNKPILSERGVKKLTPEAT